MVSNVDIKLRMKGVQNAVRSALEDESIGVDGVQWLLSNIKNCIQIRSVDNFNDDEEVEGRFTDFLMKFRAEDSLPMLYLNNRVMHALMRTFTFLPPSSSQSFSNAEVYWRIPPSISPSDLCKFFVFFSKTNYQ